MKREAVTQDRTTVTLPPDLRAQAEQVRGTQSMNAFIQDALRLLIAARTARPQPPKLGPIAGDP